MSETPTGSNTERWRFWLSRAFEALAIILVLLLVLVMVAPALFGGGV